MQTWTDVIGSEKEQDYSRRPWRPSGVSGRRAGDLSAGDRRVQCLQADRAGSGQGGDPGSGPLSRPQSGARSLLLGVAGGAHAPSLVNIYKEMQRDLPGLSHPVTAFWSPGPGRGAAAQYRADGPGGPGPSHAHLGWETFTDRVIEQINASCQGWSSCCGAPMPRRRGASSTGSVITC